MLPIILPNSSLIIALSGGPDSVYLLHQLLKLRQKLNLTIHLAHFNHQTRGNNSNLDEIFVKKLAIDLNLPITISRLSKPIKTTKDKYSEEKMRLYRYAFLEQTRLTQQADFIVTAHHYDDQIETIIFNFFRGTGPQGLTGMAPQTNHILRPLLNTPKEKIIKYLKKNNIKYRQDRSNLDTNYKRNLIRHRLVPLIKEINPQFAESISRLAQTLNLQLDFFASQTQSLIKKTKINPFSHANQPIISQKKFQSLHPALQNYYIKNILQPFVPNNKQLTAKIIKEVVHILIFSRNNSQKILFDTLSINKKNDKIYLRLLRQK